MDIVKQLTIFLTFITKIMNKGLYNFKNESHKTTFVFKTT
jgi:hypothetical protein